MDAGPEPARQTESCQAGKAAHPIMFCVLTALALSVFTPCVLMPLWYETEQLRNYERACIDVVAALKAQSARNMDRIAALQADPLVVERVMRRELNFQPADERLVHVAMPEVDPLPPLKAEPLSGAEGQPPPSPVVGWVATLSRWLPNWPWRALFLDNPNRMLFLLLAGGLQVAAFLLYAPSPPSAPQSK